MQGCCGVVGPLQYKVACVLEAASHMPDVEGLTYEQIRRVINDAWGLEVQWGSVCAAGSGMGRCQHRNWIASVTVTDDPFVRISYITPDGLYALRKKRAWLKKQGKQRNHAYHCGAQANKRRWGYYYGQVIPN